MNAPEEPSIEKPATMDDLLREQRETNNSLEVLVDELRHMRRQHADARREDGVRILMLAALAALSLLLGGPGLICAAIFVAAAFLIARR